MFELNKNLASLHSFCTRNQNVDFRGPFLLGTENPSSWELTSQTSLFTNVLLMLFRSEAAARRCRETGPTSRAKVQVCACRAPSPKRKVVTSRKANNVRFRNIRACALRQTLESGATTSQPTVSTTTTCSFELRHHQLPPQDLAAVSLATTSEHPSSDVCYFPTQICTLLA